MKACFDVKYPSVSKPSHLACSKQHHVREACSFLSAYRGCAFPPKCPFGLWTGYLLIVPAGPPPVSPHYCVPQRLTYIDNISGLSCPLASGWFYPMGSAYRSLKDHESTIYSPDTFPVEMLEAGCFRWWKVIAPI